MKQYTPKKPIKSSINVLALYDAVNRYMSEFEVYTGKKGNNVERDLGRNVVNTLTQHTANSYRHLYFDSYLHTFTTTPS